MKLPETLDGKVYNAGFTLVELLITVAILGILTAGGVGLLSRFTQSAQIEDADAQLSQGLRIAHTRAKAGVNEAAHGVYIQPHQFIIFQGSSFATRNGNYDRVVVFKEAVSFSAPFPGNEIAFALFSGTPNSTGTITITHSVNGTESITVNDLGLLE